MLLKTSWLYSLSLVLLMLYHQATASNLDSSTVSIAAPYPTPLSYTASGNWGGGVGCGSCMTYFGLSTPTPVGNAPASISNGTYSISATISMTSDPSFWVKVRDVCVSTQPSCGGTTIVDWIPPWFSCYIQQWNGFTTTSPTVTFTSPTSFTPYASIFFCDANHGELYRDASATISVTPTTPSSYITNR